MLIVNKVYNEQSSLARGQSCLLFHAPVRADVGVKVQWALIMMTDVFVCFVQNFTGSEEDPEAGFF